MAKPVTILMCNLSAHEDGDYYDGGEKVTLDEDGSELGDWVAGVILNYKLGQGHSLPYNQDKATKLGRYKITIEEIEDDSSSNQ
jgi:hypothetical protein